MHHSLEKARALFAKYLRGERPIWVGSKDCETMIGCLYAEGSTIHVDSAKRKSCLPKESERDSLLFMSLKAAKKP